MTAKRRAKTPLKSAQIEAAEIELARKYLASVAKVADVHNEQALRNRSLDVALSLAGNANRALGDVLRHAEHVYQWLANGKLPSTTGLRAVESGQETRSVTL